MAQIRKDTIARGPSLFEKSELTLHGFLLAANKSSDHYDETHVRDQGVGNAVRNTYRTLEDLGFINEHRDGPRPATPPRIGLFSNAAMDTDTLHGNFRDLGAGTLNGRGTPPYMTAYEPTPWTAQNGWATDFPL